MKTVFRDHYPIRKQGAIFVICLALLLGAGRAVPVQASVFNALRRTQSTPYPLATSATGMIIQNVGQFDAHVRFAVLGHDSVAWLTDNAIVISQYEAQAPSMPQSSGLRRTASVRLAFSSATTTPALHAQGRLGTRVSFLRGDTPADWRVDVPVWQEVRYTGVLANADLVIRPAVSGAGHPFAWELSGNQANESLHLRIEGARNAQMSPQGVNLSTILGEIAIPALVVRDAQAPLADRRQIARQLSSTSYEVITPITNEERTAPAIDNTTADISMLAYSTFLGGSSWEFGNAIAVAQDGSAYVAGRTPSPDFPTTPGAYDVTIANIDAFIARLSPDGSGLVFATYLGGSDVDVAYAIGVSNYEAYVAGETGSLDFPGSTNQGESDAFAVRLNSTGTALLYSKTWGGSDDDIANAIAVVSGVAYVAGTTVSRDYPSSSGAYTGAFDAFVAKLNTSGGIDYNTLFGGRSYDYAFGVAVHNGEAYVTGQTESSDFPGGGYSGAGDAFFARISSAGALAYARTVGGSGIDSGNGIAISPQGAVAIVGSTSSSDFPVTARSLGGGTDAFAMQLSASGYISYATFLGGSTYDEALSAKFDARSNIIVAGTTNSVDFPVSSDAYQLANAGGFDAFVAHLKPTAQTPNDLYYATYFGGSLEDRAQALAVDNLGYAYITGYTYSANFPTTETAFDRTITGGLDSFISKLRVDPAPSVEFVKLTNGQKVVTAPGPLVLAGSGVSWQYVVTNTGRFSVSAVTVIDDKPGVVPTCPFTSISSGQAMQCSATGVVVAGQYTNLGTVSVSAPDGSVTITATDRSYYFGVAPAVQLRLRTNAIRALTPPGVYVESGSPLTWTFAITNTGNISLTNITVTHSSATPITCPTTTLVAGGTMTCNAYGTAAAGQQLVSANVTGTSAVGPAATANDANYYFGATSSVALRKRTNNLDAPTAPGPYIRVGQPVSWTYNITNTSNATVTIALSDNRQGAVTCPTTVLGAGVTVACIVSGTAVSGPYSNTATVMATLLTGKAITANATSHYYGASPAVQLEKYTNGQRVVAGSGPLIPVGNAVQWSFFITNTGNVTLSSILLNDSRIGVIPCPSTTLGAGQGMNCASSGIATAGQYVNTAVVTGTPPVEGVVNASDSSAYYGSAASIGIAKFTNGMLAPVTPGPFILVGQPVTWTYHITNTGNITLNAVNLSDNVIGGVTCPHTTLAAGAAMQCGMSGVAQAGQYANTANVTALSAANQAVNANATSHYYGTLPGIALTKLTNGVKVLDALGPLILAGQPVTWSYIISNTGNITLTYTIRDNQVPVINCPTSVLAVNGGVTCTASSTAMAGPYSNTALVTATVAVSLTTMSVAPTALDSSRYFGAVPALTLVKLTNGIYAPTPPGPVFFSGNPVTWTYLVTNTGNILLNDVVVTDSREAVVTCPVKVLSSGESMVCHANGTTTAGSYTNMGVATAALPNSLATISITHASHYLGLDAEPQIAVFKLTNGQDSSVAPGIYLMSGSVVTWEYVVVNAGNVTLTNVTVVDNRVAPVQCPTNELAVGGSMTCSANGIVAAGPYSNTVNVAGLPDIESLVVAMDTAYLFGATPNLTVSRYLNGVFITTQSNPFVRHGQPITLTYHVTNTGNVPIIDLLIQLDPALPIVCLNTMLAPQTATLCTATGIASLGQQSVLGTLTADLPPGLDSLSVDVGVRYFGAAPGVAISKYVNGLRSMMEPGVFITTGSPITWTYVVTNTGNLTLTSVSVVDSRSVSVECPVGMLAPAAWMACRGKGVAIRGLYSNTGSVLAITTAGYTMTAHDTSYYVGDYPVSIYLPIAIRP